jgi:phosphatidylserine decarboxylase
LEESKYPLEHYTCLQEFFGRPLKDGLRPVATNPLTSPVDGTVLTLGPVKNHIEQVKGHSYTLTHFLGPNYKETKPVTVPLIETTDTTPAKRLYQVVLYLAPGDYHRIHSSAEWSIHKRRHFPGTLLPVAPVVGKVVPQLLALNERVVLTGEWEHGFFSMTAVGAYNVGSIRMHFDNVRTNNIKRDFRCNNLQYFSWNGLGTQYYERNFNEIRVDKGEEIGLFRLGSTVVLIFEAPEDFQFAVKSGEKIQMGRPLGVIPSTSQDM